jgi:hypothetical protein
MTTILRYKKTNGDKNFGVNTYKNIGEVYTSVAKKVMSKLNSEKEVFEIHVNNGKSLVPDCVVIVENGDIYITEPHKNTVMGYLNSYKQKISVSPTSEGIISGLEKIIH